MLLKDSIKLCEEKITWPHSSVSWSKQMRHEKKMAIKDWECSEEKVQLRLSD